MGDVGRGHMQKSIAFFFQLRTVPGGDERLLGVNDGQCYYKTSKQTRNNRLRTMRVCS